jgi:peroxiredoxin/outer membrane lipoprotein-sorting protein
MIINVSAEDNARTILDNVLNVYGNLRTYRDATQVNMTLLSEGVENAVSYNSDISIKKPYKFSINNQSDIFSKKIISDGQYIWTYYPTINKYTKKQAPRTIFQFLSAKFDNFEKMGTEEFPLFMFFDTKSDIFSSTDTVVNHLGEELLEGNLNDIIEIQSNKINITLWINRENSYIKKLTLEAMPVMQDQQVDADYSQEIKLKYEEIHSDISIDSKIPDNDFKYTPPSGASVFDGFNAKSERTHGQAYPGKKMIDFKKKPVNMKDFISLSSYKGNIMMLLFFDNKNTAISSDLAKSIQYVYKRFKSKNLTVIGLDNSGDDSNLKEFLKKNKIKFPVIYDEAGSVSRSYNVKILPTIFIIDEKGEILHIYTSYFPGLEDQLNDDIGVLLEEPEDLFKDQMGGLQKLWHLPLKATDIVVDKHITVMTTSGNLYNVTQDGSINRIIKTDSRIRKILPLKGTNTDIKYLGYRQGGRDLLAINDNGHVVWHKTITPGINDIDYVPGSASKQPAIAVAQNGIEGIQLLDHKGNEIITSTDITNAVSLSAGNLNFEKSNIAAISNDGKLYILDNKCNLIKSIDTGIYANFVKIIEGFNTDEGSFIVSGSLKNNEILQLLNNKGTLIWEIILGNADSSHVEKVKLHPAKNKIAVSTADGQIIVFDNNGDIITDTKENSSHILIDWIPLESDQINLITAGIQSGIINYILIESEY